jgi:hypothetical protein
MKLSKNEINRAQTLYYLQMVQGFKNCINVTMWHVAAILAVLFLIFLASFCFNILVFKI